MSARAEAAARLAAPADELYPPVQYGGGWLLLAAAILVVIVLTVWLILFLTRERPVKAPPADDGRPTAQALDALRGDYLRRIDEVERAYADGALTPRRANHELSGLTRAFVNEYTGIAAPVMSLDELEAHGVHPALVDAVKRHYYPSLFARGPVIDPHAGASAAREVVNAWH